MVDRAWRLLVVDDEPDMHAITELALKRRRWRGRPFCLSFANSADEARKILESSGELTFHAAFIDVVMESGDAGLQLCKYIRERYPRSLRIVLRTGQPGAGPSDDVLAGYDIDDYLAKTEATAERVLAVASASVRASLDLGLACSVQSLLQGINRCLAGQETLEVLVGVFGQSLRFLEDAHGIQIAFCSDLQPGVDGRPIGAWTRRSSDDTRIVGALAAALASGAATAFCSESRWGLAPEEFVTVMPATFIGELNGFVQPSAEKSSACREQGCLGRSEKSSPFQFGGSGFAGMHVVFLDGKPTYTQLRRLSRDLQPMLEGWRLGNGTFNLSEGRRANL